MIYSLFSWQTWLCIMIIIIFIVWVISWFKTPAPIINKNINTPKTIFSDEASFINPVNNNDNINLKPKINKIPITSVNEEYITPNSSPRPISPLKKDINEEENENEENEEENENEEKEENEEEEKEENEENKKEEKEDFCVIELPIITKKKDSILRRNTIKSIINKHNLKTGEQIVCHIMKQMLNDENLKTNVRPKFLTNPKTGRALELDCWSAKHKIAAEYNGIQHYQFPSHFYSNYTDFEKQIYRDEIKRQLAQQHNVKIITVPCTVDSYIFDKEKTNYTQIRRSLVERYELIEDYLTLQLENLI